MIFFIGVVGVVVVIVALSVYSTNNKDDALVKAAPGSVRIESVKAIHVNQTVSQYAAAGWTVADQTTAKSFGSQARVTITFRK